MNFDPKYLTFYLIDRICSYLCHIIFAKIIKLPTPQFTWKIQSATLYKYIRRLHKEKYNHYCQQLVIL
jgi:hypothetical protein